MKDILLFVSLLSTLLLMGCSAVSSPAPKVRIIATPAPLTGEGARATLRLVPPPASCCGPEVTRVVLAFRDTPGILKFRINSESVITLIYDPEIISLQEIKELISTASGLQVVLVDARDYPKQSRKEEGVNE